jgi:hypothetical protein
LSSFFDCDIFESELEKVNDKTLLKFRLVDLQHQLPTELLPHLNELPALSNYMIEFLFTPEGNLGEVCELIPQLQVETPANSRRHQQKVPGQDRC